MDHTAGIFYFVADTKGPFLLELDTGERANIRTLDRTHGGDARDSLIVSYLHDKADDDVKISYSGKNSKSISSDLEQALYYCKDAYAKRVYISGYSNRNMGYEVQSFLQEYPNLNVVNSNLFFKNILNDKDFLSSVATQAGQATMPKTLNFNSPYNAFYKVDEITNACLNHFDAEQTLVIKPSSACQGKGIVVTAKSALASTLNYIFKDIKEYGNQKRFEKDGFAENYWLQNKPDNFQVQEFVRSKPYMHKGHKWDATMRTLFSCIIEPQKGADLPVIDIEAHGSYLKLPRHPLANIQNDFTYPIKQENSISFSYGHNPVEGLKRSKIGRFLCNVFDHANFVAGSGGRIVIDHETDTNVPIITKNIKHIFEAALKMPDSKLAHILRTQKNDSQNIREIIASRSRLLNPLTVSYDDELNKDFGNDNVSQASQADKLVHQDLSVS